jgi:ATP-dependent DNA ligase
MLPQVSPSPLTSVKEPIGHPNWIYELKHDGFRGILYVDRDQAWLVSRKWKKFRQFEPLLKQVLRSLKGQRVLLDGEIVVLDEKGRWILRSHGTSRRTTLLCLRSPLVERH